jgi:asparagine synthase (glutamine-hydrolysing)
MCGITGVLNGNLSAIKIANSIISHRGNDDSGEYINHSFKVGLGHQRLSIIDTSNLGHQPMIGDKGKVVLVFNGEIYNYKELRSDLIRKGFAFKGDSDTEVLLNLYLSEGVKMLEKLNGIFAFAIWDANIKSLFVARDAFGVKPLYYYSKGSVFSFASEIKALLVLMPRDRDIDIESINRYLSFLWCPGKGTPLKSVHKLLPGEAIIINDSSIVDQWLWHQTPALNNSKINKIVNREQAITKTAEKLKQAVHRQMVSDVPLGAFLSGGLDSSAVVAFAKEVNPDIRCFSIETKGKQDKGVIDDLPYAKRVAKHLNVSLEVISIDSHKMANDLESMVAKLDEPLADPAAFNVFYISQLAKEQGIKVLLSGAGGDDLFTGYRRHYAIQLERYWSWLPTSIRTRLEKATKGLNANSPVQRRITKMFNGAGLDSSDRLINYFRWSNDSVLQSLYSLDFRQQLMESNSNQVMQDFLEPILMNSSSLDQMLALEQRFFLADHNLNYTDKMSMAAGVEVRVPFLDLDLVDFAGHIPNKFKQRGSVGKWVLKKAMEPYLPKEVIYRPKTGFGAPLRTWMKHDLRELLGDVLSIESLNRRGLFSAQAVQQLILDNDNDKIDASYTLLSLLCIEIWCRSYIDKY